MDESAFLKQAEDTLAGVLDVLDEELADHVEADLEGGVLTIELEDGGQYVINKHAPNKQIWMSSPASGAAHFDWDEGAEAWTGTRGQGDFLTMLADELEKATGTKVSFS